MYTIYLWQRVVLGRQRESTACIGEKLRRGGLQIDQEGELSRNGCHAEDEECLRGIW